MSLISVASSLEVSLGLRDEGVLCGAVCRRSALARGKSCEVFLPLVSLHAVFKLI